MARKAGGQTLELSPEDNAELLALCEDNHSAEKKWLGGAFLRYGMRHPAEALAEDAAESFEKRTRKRRDPP